MTTYGIIRILQLTRKQSFSIIILIMGFNTLVKYLIQMVVTFSLNDFNMENQLSFNIQGLSQQSKIIERMMAGLLKGISI